MGKKKKGSRKSTGTNEDAVKTTRSRSSTQDAQSKLSVRVVAARNLLAKDRNGKSDPYVALRIEIGEDKLEKYLTSTRKKTLNPTWNERLQFVSTRFKDPNAVLVIKVFDEDRVFGAMDKLRKDDFLGAYHVPLSDIPRGHGEVFDEWLALQPHETYPGEAVAGEVRIQASFGDLAWTEDQLQEEARSGGAVKKEGQRKLRELKQLERHGDETPSSTKGSILKGIDAVVGQGVKGHLKQGLALFTGKREPEANDAYDAENWLQDDVSSDEEDDVAERSEEDTEEKKRNTDALVYLIACLQHNTVEFPEGMSKEQIVSDTYDLFGIVTVKQARRSLVNLRPRHVLRNLLLQYHTLPSSSMYGTEEWSKSNFKKYSKLRQAEITSEMHKIILEPPPDEFLGRLRIVVRSGRNLPAMDVTGHSDPYCVLVMGTAVRKTKTKMRTLTPIWEEEFSLGVPSANASLEVQVWDYNHIGDPAYIGNVYVPVSSLENYDRGLDVVENWFRIEGDRGELLLRMHYDFRLERYYRALHDPDRFAAKLRMSDEKLNRSAPPPLAKCADMSDTHAQLLKQVIVRMVATVRDQNAVLDAFNCTLSKEAMQKHMWLFRAYCMRYGVLPARLHLEIVDLFIVASDTEEIVADYIEVIHEHLIALNRMSNDDNAVYVFSKAEKRQFEHLKESVLKEVIAYLSKFKVFLPRNEPAGVLSFLVDIVQEIAPVTERKAILDTAIAESTSHYFSKVAPDDEYLSTVDGMITLHELVEEQMRDDALFKHSFDDAENYDRIVYTIYAQKFIDEVTKFCNTAEYDPLVFRIYKQTNELLARFVDEADIALPNVDVFKLFTPFVYAYLKEAGKTLCQWVLNAVKEDDHIRIGDDEHYHSLGVTMIVSTVNQAYGLLEQYELNRLFISVQFAELACAAVRLYADTEAAILEDMLMKDVNLVPVDDTGHTASGNVPTPKVSALRRLQDDEGNAYVKITRSSLFRFVMGERAVRKLQALSVTEQMCVSLANVEEARYRLDEVLDTLNNTDRLSKSIHASDEPSDLEKKKVLTHAFDELSTETFTHLKQTRETMLQALCDRLHDHIESLLDRAEQNLRATIEQMLEYYDEQWAVLASATPKRVFRDYQELAWHELVASLREKLLTTHLPGADTEYILALERYFHADGAGLSRQWLSKHGKDELVDLINLQQLSTAGIIKEFHAAQRTVELLKEDASAQLNSSSANSKQHELSQAKLAELVRSMDYSSRLLALRAKQGDKRASSFIDDVSGSTRRAHPLFSDDDEATLDEESLSKEQRRKKRFGLGITSDDEELDSFVCRSDDVRGKVGRLHVFTGHLCYANTWGDGDDATPDTMVIDLTRVTRIRTEGSWTGLGSMFVDVRVESNDAINNDSVTNGVRRFVFSQFFHRKKALRMIVDTAMKHHKVQIEWTAK